MILYADLPPLLKYPSKISDNTFCRGGVCAASKPELNFEGIFYKEETAWLKICRFSNQNGI